MNFFEQSDLFLIDKAVLISGQYCINVYDTLFKIKNAINFLIPFFFLKTVNCPLYGISLTTRNEVIKNKKYK